MMPERYEIRKSQNDVEYYFVLIAPNNEIIATSEMYKTKTACENGIAAVQTYGSTKNIVYTTT